jgi:hypothetical protein
MREIVEELEECCAGCPPSMIESWADRLTAALAGRPSQEPRVCIACYQGKHPLCLGGRCECIHEPKEPEQKEDTRVDGECCKRGTGSTASTD